MDKKFDMMNPDGFSHFNGPISPSIYYCGACVWYRVWLQVVPILCSCSYFYGVEKLNVSMNIKFIAKWTL